MHISKVIEQLGYTPHEAKVYLAALSIGESTATTIAARVELPRTSVQNILEVLHKRGIISFYDKRRYRYWIAEGPEKLMNNLREQESLLKSALPRLSTLRSTSSSKPSVKVFKGPEEIRFICDDIFTSHHPIRALISWDEWVGLLGADYVKDITDMRVKHFLRIDLLVPKNPRTLRMKDQDVKELRHTRFLPDHMKIATSHYIYGSKVAIISMNKKDPTGILIDDADIAHTMSVCFEETWNRCDE